MNPQRRPPLETSFSSLNLDPQEHIRRARNGDQASLAWIAETYTPLAYRTAARFTKSDADSRDIAHDSMLKVFTRLSQYSSDWRFSTWVRTIAKNTALDLIRKRQKLSWSEVPDVADSEPTADQTLERQQVREMVRTALSELPPIYREVLEMHHFQDLKYREIASSLDIPIGTVMNRIFRARTKMRSALADRAA